MIYELANASLYFLEFLFCFKTGSVEFNLLPVGPRLKPNLDASEDFSIVGLFLYAALDRRTLFDSNVTGIWKIFESNTE